MISCKEWQLFVKDWQLLVQINTFYHVLASHPFQHGYKGIFPHTQWHEPHCPTNQVQWSICCVWPHSECWLGLCDFGRTEEFTGSLSRGHMGSIHGWWNNDMWGSLNNIKMWIDKVSSTILIINNITFISPEFMTPFQHMVVILRSINNIQENVNSFFSFVSVY